MMIADLQCRITIEQALDVADGAGGVTRGWATQAVVWASLRTAGGGRRDIADRPELAERYRIRMRWRGDVDGSRRLRHGERLLAIRSAHDPDGRRRWLDLIAEEITP